MVPPLGNTSWGRGGRGGGALRWSAALRQGVWLLAAAARLQVADQTLLTRERD